MKHLVANHVSREMHEEVNQQMLDNTLKSRWLKQQSDPNFNLAKKIVNYLPIAPTNNLLYKIYNDLKNGIFNNVNMEDFNDILNFTYNYLAEQGIIFNYRPDNTRKYDNINDALTNNR